MHHCIFMTFSIKSDLKLVLNLKLGKIYLQIYYFKLVVEITKPQWERGWKQNFIPNKDQEQG